MSEEKIVEKENVEKVEKEVMEPTTEELKQKVEKLEVSEKGWQDTAAKWRRKHDDLAIKEPEKIEKIERTEVDPLDKLKGNFEEDSFTTTAHIADRAGQFYYQLNRVENKVKRQLRKEYKDFDDHEDKIDSWMVKLSPQKRLDPEMWKIAAKIVKSEVIEDIEKIKAEAKEEGKKEASQESLEEAKDIHTQGPKGGSEKETKSVGKVTPEEEKMAARYKMSKEEYIKYKTRHIGGGEKARLEK